PVLPPGPVRGRLRRAGPVLDVHRPCPALPAGAGARAGGTGPGRRRPARVGHRQPPRLPSRADHRGRGAGAAAGRLAVLQGHVLRGHRRRRGAGADEQRAGRRPAVGRPRRLPAGFGRVRGGTDGVADGRPRLVPGVPPGQRRGLRDGGDHARRRRPPDGLRRVRAPPPLHAGGPRVRRPWRVARLHRRREHRQGRTAADEHQRRRAVLHAHRHVRDVRHPGGGAAAARRGLRAGARCRHQLRAGRRHVLRGGGEPRAGQPAAV
ncbi:MAG: acetyl-CoA acetyltransferase-like protein, partial [uncultured Thermomicrobiales bacterium]